MAESPLFAWRRALTDRDGPLTKTQRLVGLVLSLHMDTKGASCFPSTLTIAYECRVARSTVKAATKAMVVAGYLKKERRGYGKTCNYFAALPGKGRLSDFHGPTDTPQVRQVPGHRGRQEDVPLPPGSTDGANATRRRAARGKSKSNVGGKAKTRKPSRICTRCQTKFEPRGIYDQLCDGCLDAIDTANRQKSPRSDPA